MDDVKRIANMAARKIAMTNQGMTQDASRWDTMRDPAAMAQYQGPPAPVTVGNFVRDMMDPAHMPMRPVTSIGEAVQQAGTLLPVGMTKVVNPYNASLTGPTPVRFELEHPNGQISLGKQPYGRYRATVGRGNPEDVGFIVDSQVHPTRDAAAKWAIELLDRLGKP